MPFKDAHGDRKPEAGTGGLGGKERIEKALLHLRGNSGAGVLNFEDDDFLWLPLQGQTVLPRAERDAPLLADALGSVADEIDEHR